MQLCSTFVTLGLAVSNVAAIPVSAAGALESVNTNNPAFEKHNIVARYTSANDKERFVRKTLDEAREIDQEVGFVVCNTAYSTTGRVMYTAKQVTHEAYGSPTVTYDVVLLKFGEEFVREGDGGWENWGYNLPEASKCVMQSDGKTIKCAE